MAPAYAGGDKHSQAGGNDDHEGAGVWLKQEQSAGKRSDDEKREKSGAEMPYGARGSGEPCRQINNERKFHEFGGLPGQGAELNPAGRASRTEADIRHEHQCHSGERRNKNEKRVFPQKTIVDIGGDEEPQSPQSYAEKCLREGDAGKV